MMNTYKSRIKSMWAYESELCGTAKTSNNNENRTLKSKKIRQILIVRLYIIIRMSNETDFHIVIPTVINNNRYIISFKLFHNRFRNHPNPLIDDLTSITLLSTDRIERKWCRNFIYRELKKKKKDKFTDD